MKFVQLILRKIIKIVATTCQILRLKCTKFDFGWGSAPDPAGGPLITALSQTPSWIWGPLRSRGGAGLGERRERGGEGEGGGKWREGKGRPPSYC